MLVSVVGNYGGSDTPTNGQSIKTHELYRALVQRYGAGEVGRVDLHGGDRLAQAMRLLIALVRSKNIIVLVSENGRRTVIPLLVSLNRLFHRRIFHSLIGSKTHVTLDEDRKYLRIYNSLSGNWSETETEKRLLEARGLTNVTVVRNFKNLRVLRPEEMLYAAGEPLPLCTFSRVAARKGIPEIVRAVKRVNATFGRTVFTLDIYGAVVQGYEEEFRELQAEFDESIHYRGVVDFDKSVETLKHYFMLVFPTKYFMEGLPGTLLDAFSAGVPVLSAQWESCRDIMNDDVGVCYAFGDDEALFEALVYAAQNVSVINGMKQACLAEARKYSASEVIAEIGKYLEGQTK